MTSFVALLRGINVYPSRKLPMSELRAVCLGLGLHHPETYIQSGNLIVEAEGGMDDLRETLGLITDNSRQFVPHYFQ